MGMSSPKVIVAAMAALQLCSASAWSPSLRQIKRTCRVPGSRTVHSLIHLPAARGSTDERHDYTRDPNDVAGGIDTEDVNALIAQRLACRRSGRYRQADGIRDHLRSEYGVEVNDGERTWSTSSPAPQSSGDGPRNKRDRIRRGPKQDFGPNGHDYRQTGGPLDGGVCSLAEDEIHALLAERLRAKLDRNFRKADNIQHMLWDKGVRIHDKRKEWRADGASFGVNDVEERRSRRGERASRSSCVKAPHSQPLSPQDEEYVIARVDLRMRAKRDGDYALADEIRDELRDNLNVEIDDRLRQWSAGGDFGNNKKDYATDNDYFFVGNVAEVDVDQLEAIEGMLAQRGKAKRARNYKVADSIRNDLRSFGVRVDDKRKSWQFDVKRDGETDNQAKNRSDDMDETIQAKIPWGDDMDDEYGAGGAVDDSDGIPYFEVKEDVYKKSLNSRALSQDGEVYVAERLARRVQASLERDFDTVDAIKTELELVHDVHISDELGQWSVGGVFDVDAIDGDSLGEDRREAQDYEQSSSSADTEQTLELLTIPVLKEKLRERGLKLSGRKSELISRLLSGA